ncbi:MAG: transposase, partial [Bacteroidota bacterium]
MKSFASRFKESKQLLGKDGALTPLIKEFLEEALVGELEAHIDAGEEPNRKNGKLPKTLKTNFGQVEIQTPRDRNGTFEPEIVGKRQRTLGLDLDRQILALYARGNSLGDISDHIQELYGIEVSTATVSRVTDKIMPLI